MKTDAQSDDYDEGEKSAQRRACGVRVSFTTKEGRAHNVVHMERRWRAEEAWSEGSCDKSAGQEPGVVCQ